MRYALALTAALLNVGCGTSSASPAASGDAGTADVAIGVNGQPCWQYVFCVQDGGLWNCDCGGPTRMPACLASAGAGGACSGGDEVGIEGCYACSEGAGLGCACTDAGPFYDGGPSASWLCVGAGNACR
jgi:hypothetical protein